MRTSDMPNVKRMRLKKECAERLEFFLRVEAGRYYRMSGTSVEFVVEHDAEMMFLAVWRAEPAPEGWRRYPAFGLMFNPYMGWWTVYEWSENAQWWDDAELECDYRSLEGAYEAARRHDLVWARPEWKSKEARA
ncbi:hypothetical protein Srot_2388 [Segniliparus rotundus DSM 44985]|uniref:Uncharacterized protein n=1 Tax=Segniliparus rotundus (strain ATCC BAA-972 / CDC 1076 / CIP 108378 / DSM 44985 / JCM 13578) TaxID=640132 RepID=D6ZAU6_SEGRD|nr:hypothetical protein [Segniliparus rotundus]ADG98832.1 hypothetical protein Srot_2388 [Segniliparus rotundus DSM 44985]